MSSAVKADAVTQHIRTYVLSRMFCSQQHDMGEGGKGYGGQALREGFMGERGKKMTLEINQRLVADMPNLRRKRARRAREAERCDPDSVLVW